jgi:rhamnogalacturonyl hydrolase YesR
VGWVSGIPWAYALLRHGVRSGDGREVEAARRVIDFIARNLSPSGTFWGVWYREHGWTQSWTELKRGLHSRTLGEATLFLNRALGIRPHEPAWERAVRSNLDAVVARQRVDGNLGAVHHAETGEVLSWSGSAGLMWVAALAEARDSDARYLPAAIRAGEYYAEFVQREFLHGAPEDVDLAPTSEDGYVAVMAYVALYEATTDLRWLDLARRSADWMLTFRYSYDVSFDPRTLLGAYDFGTRGADQASPSNQHLHAYGLICTRELLVISAALGDPHYAERADETLACFRQFVARTDGDFNAYRGMVSERYYQTSCFQPKGMLLTLSHAWSVGVLLLGCEQALEAGRG